MTAGFFCGRRFFIIEDFYGGVVGVVPKRDVSKGMWLLMHVAEGEHGNQLLLFGVVETASGFEFLWVFISPEQHVPPNNVTIIIYMPLILMMNAVHLWPLEKIANPAGRPDPRMIEKFTDGRAKGIYPARHQIQTQYGVNQNTANERVHNHFQRVFIEGCDHLYPLRTVVNLVKYSP